MFENDEDSVPAGKIFLINEEDLLEDNLGAEHEEGAEAPAFRSSPSESRFMAEIVSFLESDLGLDPRRLIIGFRKGVLYVQGSVDSLEVKTEVETLLAARPGVMELDSRLVVQQNIDD